LIHIKTHDGLYRLSLHSDSGRLILYPALADISQNKGLCQNHVSAEVNQMPDIESSCIYPRNLDHFLVRQALHVTFGSILAC
jgi:hypothetical protein